MLQVSLTGSLRSAADGAATVELEATTVRELIANLVARFPAMQSHVDAGVAVAINGVIFQDKLAEPIPPDAEVFVLPRIAGG